jgi:hypothetical protein
MPNRTNDATESAILGRSQIYIDIIDQVLAAAQKHTYKFLRDDIYQSWRDSPEFSVAGNNYILGSELVDKAHLAAISSLVRTRRWSDAICQSYEIPNYIAWAAAARGLLESAGDIWDGLGNISMTLAENTL